MYVLFFRRRAKVISFFVFSGGRYKKFPFTTPGKGNLTNKTTKNAVIHIKTPQNIVVSIIMVSIMVSTMVSF
jgi:hypothetical protein